MESKAFIKLNQEICTDTVKQTIKAKAVMRPISNISKPTKNIKEIIISLKDGRLNLQDEVRC